MAATVVAAVANVKPTDAMHSKTATKTATFVKLLKSKDID